MLSSDLFVVQVPVLGVLRNMYTVNEFVCSLSTVLNTGTLTILTWKNLCFTEKIH